MRYTFLLMLAGCTAVFGGRVTPKGEPVDASCSCAAPPVAQCLDASTLRSFLPGVCSDGACTYAHSDTQCASSCASGACTGNDPCGGIVCNSPPTATCASTSTLQTYSSSGMCANGSCSYASMMTTCSNGCTNNQCEGDPCAGIVCNQPPATTCLNTTTLRSFSSGSCANGQCSYAPTDTTCTNGCSGNACVGDPCAGVTCNQPPASTCIDTSTLRAFSATGSCSAGTCGYSHDDTTCTSAPANASPICSNGACDFTCSAGYNRSGTACFAVGDGGVTLTWTQETSLTGTALYGVWGSGPDDVYAVGDGVIVHSNGASWTPQTTGDYGFRAVWGSSANDVYAVGSGGAVSHTSDQGTTWSQVVIGVAANYGGVWGSSASDVYIVGDSAIAHSTNSGATWNVQANATGEGYFHVWGSGPNDVYAVGQNLTGGKNCLVSHTSNGGANWIDTTNPCSGIALLGIWGASASEVYVVDGDGFGDGGIWRSTNSGATWSAATTATNDVNAIWGSGPGDFYVVGQTGELFHTTDGGASWNYTVWNPGGLFSIPTFYAVWGSSPTDIYVVGTGGWILHGHL
jgi:photosystem II stability/assembly factor-like uncharacterized protein